MNSDRDGKELSVSTHLDELRSRVTKSVLAVVVTTAIAFAFHRQILLILMEPAKGFEQTPYSGPIYTQLTEFISIAFKVSLLAGLFLALPFVLYQVVMFVAPGLAPKERRATCTSSCPRQSLRLPPGPSSDIRSFFPLRCDSC